jgi:hypothetical protein
MTIIDTISALEATRRKAMLAGDTDTLARLIGAECTYVHSTGAVDSGADYVAKLRRGDFAYEAIEIDQQSIHLNDSVATVVFRMRAGLVVGDVRRDATCRCTAVWVTSGTTHALTAFQSTPIA